MREAHKPARCHLVDLSFQELIERRSKQGCYPSNLTDIDRLGALDIARATLAHHTAAHYAKARWSTIATFNAAIKLWAPAFVSKHLKRIGCSYKIEVIAIG